VAIRVEDPNLVNELNAYHVTFTDVIESTLLRGLMSWILLVLIFDAIWSFTTVGQSKAKIYGETDTKVTFAEVADVDEAKEALRDVMEFLKTPEQFTRLGGKTLKGIHRWLRLQEWRSLPTQAG
jgi:cell division protease FtsH